MDGSESRYYRRLLGGIGLVLAVGLLVTIVWLSIKVWLTVFAGVLLAVFFRTLARWVSKITRLPTGWSLVVVAVVLLGLATLFGWLLAPSLNEQFGQLSQRLPKAFEQIEQRFNQSNWNRYVPKKMPSLAEITGSVGKLLTNAGTFFSVSVEAMVIAVVIFVLGVYLAATPQSCVRGLVMLFPIPNRPRIEKILDKIGIMLGHWLLGQLASMTTVGILIATGLTLLGIPLGLALGVLAGMLNFVPIIGSLVSALPAILLGFLVSPLHPVYVILLYLLVNGGIESHLIVPLVQRFAIKLPPAIGVVALFFMGEMFGFLGLLLAIPLTATLVVLVQTIYVEDILGDDGAIVRGSAEVRPNCQ